ncbi:MAG TPA: hypothetical protein VFJ58_10455 [Armatimonadota bacterium]|nr:hypothetical protein [Armatimonadota bacterium]
MEQADRADRPFSLGARLKPYPERYLVRRFAGLASECDIAEWLNEVAAFGYRLSHTSASGDTIWVFVEDSSSESKSSVEAPGAADPADRSVHWIRK